LSTSQTAKYLKRRSTGDHCWLWVRFSKTGMRPKLFRLKSGMP
jgi:hypothetical protein